MIFAVTVFYGFTSRRIECDSEAQFNATLNHYQAKGFIILTEKRKA